MIDWFTVVAQIINFLVLVLLLKHFLYGRIVSAMDQREAQIAERWQAAEQKQHDAEQELAAARQKNLELEEQREELLSKVRNDAESYRQELTAKVRDEMDQQQLRWSEAIREETAAFLQDLRNRASQEICDISRQALRDLADAELETCIVEKFLHRLQHLDDDAKQDLLDSLEKGERTAAIQTAFQLSDVLRDRLSTTLKNQLGDDLDMRFEESTDLMCGIALHTNAHKLAWELSDYLTDLEQEMRNALEEEASRTGAETAAV